MKVIVAGSRNFNNYNLLEKILDEFNSQVQSIDEIVCGEARGADSLGRRWAEKNNIPVKSFPAQWEKFGKSAGFLRNRQMGDYADYLIAFWDGQSKGTKHMIDYMREAQKHGRVIVWTN